MNEVKNLSKKEFKKMHKMQFEMLVEFDKVCRENNIKYCIWSGTLLGAVRHKGFIPWDDDIDIAMLREEYEKFKKIHNQLNSNICYFQDNDTDPEYRWGYGKLRRTNTKFVRVGQKHLKCKTGIFVDVFPLDDIPHTTIGQMLNDFHCFIIRKILYSEVGKFSNSETKFTRFVYSLLSKIPLKKVFKHFNKMTLKSKNSSSNLVRVYGIKSLGKYYFKHKLKERYGLPKEWLLDLDEYEFEGKKFFGPKDYDAFLKHNFGDYMTLPPEDQRDPHAPVCDYSFDTTKN